MGDRLVKSDRPANERPSLFTNVHADEENINTLGSHLCFCVAFVRPSIPAVTTLEQHACKVVSDTQPRTILENTLRLLDLRKGKVTC